MLHLGKELGGGQSLVETVTASPDPDSRQGSASQIPKRAR